MARVAVVFPPMSVSRDFIDAPHFADLGALQAAAVLRDAAHDVSVIDALAMPGATVVPDGEPTRLRLGAPREALIEALAGSHAEVVIVVQTPFHRPGARDAEVGALLAAAEARLPGAWRLLADCYQSGHHVVDVPPDVTLAAYPEADVLLRHEAEDALAPLVARCLAERRGAGSGLPRVVEGGEVDALDALPPPAWDLVDRAAYWRFHQAFVEALGRGVWAFPLGGASLPLITSRGCPYRCLHCSSNPGRAPGSPKRQRRLSAAKVRWQVARLKELGATRVHLLDELANLEASHLDAVLDALVAEGLSLEIPNGLRADRLSTGQMERLRGLVTTLSVSAESGSERVLREVVGKALELGEVRRVAAEAARLGLPLLIHWMLGLPGETKAELNETLALALELFTEHGARPSVQFATPLPGTRLAVEALRAGGRLPVLSGDAGPLFQHVPSTETAEFTRDELRCFKETFERRLAALEGPKKVILNVTYRCNNHCTFCAVGNRTQRDGDFDRQRELLLSYRREGATLLDLDGGEPTLNPRLVELIQFARAIGYERVHVTTNGRLASYEQVARRLMASGLTSLLFSLHGPTRALHAANVRVPEAFEQTVRGIERCVTRRREGGERERHVELGVNVTLTRSNAGHLHELADLVLGLGVSWLNVQFLTPFGRATAQLAPPLDEAAAETMRVLAATRDRMKLCVVNAPACLFPGYEDFVVGDLMKLRRTMVFVNDEAVNLFEYLGEQRAYEPRCAACPRRVFCGGFYQLRDVPAPPWLDR